MINTPINPMKTAVNLIKRTFSLSIAAAKTTVKMGAE